MKVRFESGECEFAPVEEILAHKASCKDRTLWYPILELLQEDFNVSLKSVWRHDGDIEPFSREKFVIERAKLFKPTIAKTMSFAASGVKNKLWWRELTICRGIYA